MTASRATAAPQGHNAAQPYKGLAKAGRASGGPRIASEALLIELGYRGIIVPMGVTHHRQPCPECPPVNPRISRNGNPSNGNHENPLDVRIISDTEASVMCHRCGTTERIAA